MVTVEVRPELLRWAISRAGLQPRDLSRRFPHLEQWERGERSLTLRQLEAFATATRTPIGFLFLDRPPVERVPIPDFRTLADNHVMGHSPDLLDTIYLCQQRQQWYRDFSRAAGEQPREFVASRQLKDDIESTAAEMRSALGFSLEERRALPTWSEALRRFIEHADALGVLVMCSGVVGNNTQRPLDPNEFRGFALTDDLAPLVFVNGADTKAAQMFTLAHELAHVWLGQSAVSDAQPSQIPHNRIEKWCNQVAAELLVPLAVLRSEYQGSSDLREALDRLARRFKVSTLVILRRLHDAGWFTREYFWTAYHEEVERLRAIPRKSGGNFYLTLGARAGKRFARAIVSSTLEGQTSFTEAFRLLGLKKMSSFHQLGQSLGVVR